MDNFRFASPWLFVAGIFLVPVIWKSILDLLGKNSGNAKIHFSSIESFVQYKKQGKLRFRFILPIIRIMALVLFVLALARPQAGRAVTEINTNAVDILLALDTSKSMEAMDFFVDKKRVTRLEAVIHVVRQFVESRSNDRIGMVVFGEEAFTQSPQTLDHGIILSFLDELQIGMAGDATVIGSAIGVSTKRLKSLKSKSKVMILLTDGRSNAGFLSPAKASELAKTFGIKIYTIGVGSTGKAPFMVNGFFGKQLVYQEVDLDEDTLKQVAQITGGKYFRATDTEALGTIYQEIDRLEKTKIQTKQFLNYSERFPFFVFLGLILLSTEIVLSNTYFRKIP